jgi:hypothetical protein
VGKNVISEFRCLITISLLWRIYRLPGTDNVYPAAETPDRGQAFIEYDMGCLVDRINSGRSYDSIILSHDILQSFSWLAVGIFSTYVTIVYRGPGVSMNTTRSYGISQGHNILIQVPKEEDMTQNTSHRRVGWQFLLAPHRPLTNGSPKRVG